VVVLAATNRADMLDPALLRPGRFDRRVPVDLPDREGRLAILKVHARSKPLDGSVDLATVAGRTTGMSGASLSNLLNEAAIVTARRDKKEISMSEIEYALDRLTVGMEKTTGMGSEKRAKLVAYHEAGHALVGLLCDGYDEVSKVTIVPRTNGAGGFTLFMPSDEQQDSGMYTRAYLEARLEVALGGRVAEELVFGEGEVTTGASNDLQQVAGLARRMVTQWGFSADSIGMTAWESPNGSGYGTPYMASEATQESIDDEVTKLVTVAYAKCKEKLTANRAVLDAITDLLVKEETIDAAQLRGLVASLGSKATPALAAA
jgi:cell division protease FtsH